MQIRHYQDSDYESVWQLLNESGVEPPREKSDLKGLCFVAEDDSKIAGVIWALIGYSTTAYIDFFAVHPDYRSKKLGWALLSTMDKALKMADVHRYYFYLEPDNKEFLSIIEKYKEQNRVERLRDLIHFRREIV